MKQFYVSYHLNNGEVVAGGNYPAETAQQALELAGRPWHASTAQSDMIMLTQTGDAAIGLLRSSVAYVSVETEEVRIARE